MICEGGRILVVEDEPEMSRLLEQSLRESGFEVSVAANGREGLRLAPGHDVLLVDVMMPAMVSQLRSEGVRTPVLFLTARDSIQDVVSAFELGADDYLVKPFKLAELLARLKAVVRRHRAGQEVLIFDDLWMDRRKRKAKRGRHWLYLSNTEFSLLELFLVHPEEVLSKKTILREVWNEEAYRDDNVVEVYINYLRRKVETMGQSRVIQTVRGKGYVLERSPKES